MISPKDIIDAEYRIRDIIRETPIEYSSHLSELSDCRVFLKLEHLQHTGSFKLRGASNKMLSLTTDELQRGVIAASTGNHGLGVCYAAKVLCAKATIYLPRDVSEKKLSMMKNLGGITVLCGDDCLDAENKARSAALESGRIFISPYNDFEVIAGQGTIGIEISRRIDNPDRPGHIDSIYIAVGGGGLISGIALYLKSVNQGIRPGIRIVGCWPENSRVLYECLRAGEIIEFPEQSTVSVSTAGGVETGSVTFPLCQQLIDDFVLVSEDEIRAAMQLILEKDRWAIEGAAGVAVAAFLKDKNKAPGQTAVILLCGGNS